MKQLSDTLNAMTFEEDTQKARLRGSTTTGSTISIAPRSKPLTDAELMRIASGLLVKPPFVTFEKQKKYEKKYDDQGVVRDVLVGEEFTTDIVLDIRDGADKALIESALRQSPDAAILKHLQRLSLHKILGSSEKDRSILLHDYAVALGGTSEFIVWTVCKAFWEDDGNKFFPKIFELKRACSAISDGFQRAIVAPTIPPKPKFIPRVREEESDRGKSDRAKLIKFMKEKGDENDYSNDRFYSNYQLECIASSKFGWKSETANG